MLRTILAFGVIVGFHGRYGSSCCDAFVIPRSSSPAGSNSNRVVGDTLSFPRNHPTSSTSALILNIRTYGFDMSFEELDGLVTEEDVTTVIDPISGYRKQPKKNHKPQPIIPQYKPNRCWLWRRWKGTLLQHGLKGAAGNMIVATLLCVFVHQITGTSNWICLDKVVSSDILLSRLAVFDKLWHYQMTLTTFILTFFVTQAYNFWRHMYDSGRSIQSKCNDIGLLVATHAKRSDWNDSNGSRGSIATSGSTNGSVGSQYVPEARAVMKDVQSYIKTVTVLFWASQSRRLRILLSKRGLNKMVEHGMMTENELLALRSSNMPRYKWYTAYLEWITIRVTRARQDGVLDGGEALDRMLLQKCCDLRYATSAIKYQLSSRMPLPYAHFVQLLVDTLLFGAPFALLPELGALAIPCTGLLTLFYGGLLDLAKVFLDPLDNEDYAETDTEMDLSVLTNEISSEAVGWERGADMLPWTMLPSPSS
eukprot:CAMPEP_0197455208 /NCGR_PEP_ID=MMETSP1175-20131217/40174_1 /TAXON_ID=1003142 /ORGANISM="Triceratium dubium, Strain CCMP147" /LENGTH=478 /DNA_ID=CAMNT_0042988999 /DNA_START=207 /DNA_END=1643 /DNA_ORIENTATION=+